MNDRERITRLEIRCEQLQLTVNEAFHWIDILKSDLSDLQDKVGYADRKTEPTTEDCSTVPTSSKMEQVEDEPQTEPLQTCSVNGRPYSECSSCKHFKCTADEPQTDDIGVPWTDCQTALDEPQKRCDECIHFDKPYKKRDKDGMLIIGVECDGMDEPCDKWTDEPQTEREGE